MSDTLDGQLTRFAPHLPPALEELALPCYILDSQGRIRWVNEAAAAIVGNVTGKLFSSVVDPDDLGRARHEFAQRLRGERGVPQPVDIFTADGRQTTFEISGCPIEDDHHVIGVFGVAVPRSDPAMPRSPMPDPRLTPRQHEILVLLANGASTDEICKQLYLSRETVRNHIRHILQRLGVHSRIEALVVAHRDGMI